jgi:hypothetical protein
MQIYVNIETFKYQEIDCHIFSGECNTNEIDLYWLQFLR